MGNSLKSAMFLIESRLADAARGDPNAYFDLGIAYSSGAADREVYLIQAHKWFNLAALAGSSEAHACRAEISEEMTAREIAEAQRQARAWLNELTRRAA
jgi:TPR repeat protein